MQAHELDVIDRWRRFVKEVETQVLRARGGRLVKSLGDGLLLEFDLVPSAAAAAVDIQHRIGAYKFNPTSTSVTSSKGGMRTAASLFRSLGVRQAAHTLSEEVLQELRDFYREMFVVVCHRRAPRVGCPPKTG